MTKPYVLAVEDEPPIQKMLAYNLRASGYEVGQAYDGEEAALLVQERMPDLLLVDWMLPRLSGLELCRRLRRSPETAHLPIILLTARTDEADKLRGLETGADDYVTKPFSPAELIARIKAVLRRVRPAFSDQELRFADITMDLSAHRVFRDDRELQLSPTEFRLLRHFMENPKRVFDRSQLLDRVWGTHADVELRTVDATIRRLRKALNSDGASDVLRTVRAEGYALDNQATAVN